MSSFKKGDRVWFAHSSKGTIFGTVKSVNRKSLTLVDCSDGPRGWRASPWSCHLVTATNNDPGKAKTPAPVPATAQAAIVARSAPAIGLPADCFGKTFVSGRRTYRITGINLRAPAYPVLVERQPDGKRFKFPAQLVIEGLGGPKAVPVITHFMAFQVGQTVSYDVRYSFTARGPATITGVVTQVDKTNGTYEVYGEGRTSTLDSSKVSRAAKRSDSDILSAISGVYAGLSPENLTCDGEASRAHVRKRSAELNRALRALQTELGRQVSEGQAYAAGR